MDQPRESHDYVGEAAAKPGAKSPWVYARRAVMSIASLRLTIVLFVLALVIVFFGTLAQKRASLNTVLDEYFYCYVCRLDLNLISDFTQVFFKFRFLGTEEDPKRVVIYFPGGFTIGWLMVVNLTAAHLVRFKLSWKRLGLWVLHAGVIVLLAGEFVRANYAVEDRITLREGQSTDYVFSLDHSELVFLRPGASGDDVVSVPAGLLEKAVGGAPVTHPDLPFDLKVVKYMRNTSNPALDSTGPVPVAFGEANPATAGVGRAVKLSAEKEVSSVKGNGRINLPGSYVTVTDKATGTELGTYLFGLEIEEPQPVGDWAAVMRLKRTYLPYTVHAVKVERVNWPGTEKPKEFRSVVRIENPVTQETREVPIEMNSPLRYEGRTFYQSSMDQVRGTNTTGLQVVQNPGAHVPYVACILITLGMAAHFLLKLVEFLNRRARR